MMGSTSRVDGEIQGSKSQHWERCLQNEISKTSGSGRNCNYKVKAGSKSSNRINFGLIRENLTLPGPKNIAKNRL